MDDRESYGLQDEFIEQIRNQFGLLICEYWDLGMKDFLSEAEGDRLEEILEISQLHASLSFVLDEIDHILAHERNLVDPAIIQQQRDKLRAKIQQEFPTALDSVWLNYVLDVQKREMALRIVQMALQQIGVYGGKIDGEYGPKTREAFRDLRERLKKQDYDLDRSEIGQENLSAIVRANRMLTDDEQLQILQLEAQFAIVS